MRLRSAFNKSLLLSLLLLLASISAPAQDEVSRRIAPAVATILTRNGAEGFKAVGSGVFVRSDGVLLTAYNLVQNAREIQVRMSDGETYDHVEVVSKDERRNIAVLSVYAANTPFIGISVTDESAVGVEVRAVYNTGGGVVAEAGGLLSSISLADEIAGAGTGFRVLKFTAPVASEASGGILVDSYGRVLGLIAPLAEARTRNYAVPLYTVSGLARSVPRARETNATLVFVPGPRSLNPAIPIPQSSTTPIAPMPQVSVPQRPTTALMPAGPGSVVVRETDPGKLLAGSRTLYVTSDSNLFKPVQLVNELRKRQEFADWNLSFVDEREVADLVLNVEHIPLTWEFPFSIRHQRTGIVVATGKIYAWGGGDGAQLMAARVVERLTKIRASVKTESKTQK